MQTMKDFMSAQAKIIWGLDDKSQHRTGKRTTFPEDISSKENLRKVSGPKTRAMRALKASQGRHLEMYNRGVSRKRGYLGVVNRKPEKDTGIWAQVRPPEIIWRTMKLDFE